MKPADMTPGDHVLVNAFSFGKRKIVESVETLEPSPGMSEYTFLIRYTDGSAELSPKSRNYESWY